MAHTCPRCFKTFTRPSEVARHLGNKKPCAGGYPSLLGAESSVLARLESRIMRLEADLNHIRDQQTNALVNIFIGETHINFHPTDSSPSPNPARVRHIIQQVEADPRATIHIDNPEILMCVVRALGEKKENIDLAEFIIAPEDGDSLPPRMLPAPSPC